VAGIKNKILNRLKKWHRWPALILSFFIISWALSGIVMNHRELFSGIELSRDWMADEYKYKNWNNAAIKSSLNLPGDSILIYGNTGIWLSIDNYKSFEDFNQGFAKGVDNRKIYSMLKTSSGNLYAGTLFGLFYRDQIRNEWVKIELPIENERITSLIEVDKKLMVMTRSQLLISEIKRQYSDPTLLTFAPVNLLPPMGYTNKAGLFKTLWVIHSGEIYGTFGKLVIDLMGLLVVALTITGTLHFLVPYIIRRRKRKQKEITRYSSTKKISVKWHKQVGVVIVIFVFINSMTGMFLRPPLLIPIARAKVEKIRFSSLDNPNPWHDKLRAIQYDEELEGYMIGTNEGIYYAHDSFKDSLVPAPLQPPLSVMGINVFEKIGQDEYLVGTFNGLYNWKPMRQGVIDVFTGLPPKRTDTRGKPISENMISGLIKDLEGRSYIMDYNHGAIPLNHTRALSEMPDQILETGKMSLWNLALEIHTARFFKFLFGDFYILFIPIFGLSMILLNLTGLWIWIKLYRRKRKSTSNINRKQMAA